MFQSLNKDRVIFRVSDLEKAKDWYRRILGKEPSFDADFGVIFSVGNTELVLYPDAAKLSRSSAGAIAYCSVDDVDTAYKLMLQSGAVSLAEINTVFGEKRATILDPFGNVIVIIARQ